MAQQDTHARLEVDAPSPGRSLWSDARRRFFNNRAAMGSVFLLCAIALFAVFGPIVNPNSMEAMDYQFLAHPPTLANSHWFGTDSLGRDLFVRTAFGARISLSVAALSVLLSGLFGVLIGMVAGFLRGWVETILMRLVDISVLCTR